MLSKLAKAALGAAVGTVAVCAVLFATVPSEESLRSTLQEEVSSASSSQLGIASPVLGIMVGAVAPIEMRDYLLFKIACANTLSQQIFYLGILGRWVRASR